MIKKKGDLFTAETYAIGQGVNCKGVMGAGIAAKFRSEYPENYLKYRQMCSYNALRPGKALLVEEKGKLIVNMATQDFPGADATLARVYESAQFAAHNLSEKGIDLLAIPLIGCGIGGLKWPDVEDLLLRIEKMYPGFQFEVWRFDS